MAPSEPSDEMLEKLKNLPHVSKELPGGGMVFVLNTGALITPEAEAMLQALHSRSVGGIREHLKILAAKGSEKFMSTFYVGYGHKSIGDCGSATIFIEGVSMLAAKAIQDYPLYSGQESSTRYIDFSKQLFIDPVGTQDSKAILETWREFYLRGVEEMIRYVKEQCPKSESETDVIYEKAVKARAFDIMRSFLPAGASTNLAWHTNLRQFGDRVLLLRNHPLQEVRGIGETIEKALLEAFPSSFSAKRYEETEKFISESVTNSYFFEIKDAPDFRISFDGINDALVSQHKHIFEQRPSKTELPKWLDECGSLQFEFLLDFGSFRDIHRHRAVSERMPLVTTAHGFGSWYLNELSGTLRKDAENLLRKQDDEIKKLPASNELKQYYTGMGYNLPIRVTGGLPALTYLAELRSGITVHPTLRVRAIQMGETIEKRLGQLGIIAKLHLDRSSDRFNTKRGKDDIVKIS